MANTENSPTGWRDPLDLEAVRHARILPLDVVQAKGNGHAGTAVSLTPALYVLFQEYLRHDPARPDWEGRDRFVLSAGHTSLSLYLQHYLSGYGLELDDLKKARALGSLTPGHPEWGHTPGVETTTGPLGQGVGNAVGLAMSARRVHALLEPDVEPDAGLFRYRTWCVAGDGCLSEGVSQEASSLAGTLGLDGLILVWDDNRISIEGDTAIAFTEDVVGRYRSYGWAIVEIEDAEDPAAIRAGYDAAVAVTDRPVFIRLRTRIGHPMPTVGGTAGAHSGAPGEDEVAATKVALGLDPEQFFAMPSEALDHARRVRERGAAAREEWQRRYDAWRAAHPEPAALHDRMRDRDVTPTAREGLAALRAQPQKAATRIASGAVLNEISAELPWLWGGSADLAETNNVAIKDARSFTPTGYAGDEWPGGPDGTLVHFGIREHAMGAVLNGIALAGYSHPFGATFFVFSDYMRPSVRLAALMGLPVTYVWTHDSVGVGEDGPTHQPVEHLWAHRAIPGLDVVRPADWVETVDAWSRALGSDRPTALVLSRQGVPVVGDAVPAGEGAVRGAYVLADVTTTPDAIIVATGSEVGLALQARDTLANEGIGVRVVSAPCLEWFEEQDLAYRESVLPRAVTARVSVEAGTGTGWHRYVGTNGEIVSVEEFGASGAGDLVLAERGITAEAVVAAVHRSIATVRSDEKERNAR
ncbi:transketolase [Aeromicrobium choanae]|uniref:Transketolase n=1 Tax=Aeromicrobium choanae TaxID=1736691 RepID=A0A1T4Z2L9_9ACTN|nr:transketolase [Aeromicrobium choanae]SKB08299.1 transketolase [Aeromicrobium choanae]